MQKTVLTFGIIAGLIISILFYATSFLWMNDGQMNMSSSMIFGYLNMLISLSMVFVGIKQYRDRHIGGKITFGKAFVIGLLITAIASVFYVIVWMIYWETTDISNTFATQYAEHMKAQWVESGMSEEKILEKTAKMERNFDAYESNALLRIGMTFAEIFPVGLIISLISAWILKRK
jgi:hypothetical protein